MLNHPPPKPLHAWTLREEDVKLVMLSDMVVYHSARGKQRE